MAFRRRFVRRRRRARWRWIRQSFQPTINATLMNIDLLALYRTAAGISINLPEFTIWRIRLKISILITTGASALSAADGVLLTVFTDSQAQTPVAQISNPYDQQDMIYDLMYVTEAAMELRQSTAGQWEMYKTYDIKAHRKLPSLNQTLWLQLSASGNATILDCSISHSTLLKEAK